MSYDACPAHNPVQHRDGKPPWCDLCGRTADGNLPIPRRPEAVELDAAVLRFRASGGTIEQLDVLSRMAARGRLYAEDLAALEAAGIKMPHPAD